MVPPVAFRKPDCFAIWVEPLSLFTVPQYLSLDQRRKDLLNLALRGTMQAIRDMKNAPRPCRRKTPARAGERF